MDVKTYKKGDIIFRQGDPADSMYDILWGTVGIYIDYGTDKEQKLTELEGGAFFGEMGMIDHMPRSATAVVLEKGTQLQEITEEMLGELFKEKPAKVLAIMQQLSRRLRKLTGDYMKACKTAAGAVKMEEKPQEVSPEAADQLYSMMNYYSIVRPFDYT